MRAHTLSLSQPYDTHAMARWIANHRDAGSALIVLGHQAIRAVQPLNTGLPLVVGGINHLPERFQAPSVSVVIDPALFLDRMQQLLPNTRTVTVIYLAHQSAILPQIEQAAQPRRVSVQPVPVTDAIDAVRQITRVFDRVDPRSTALWFTTDTLSLDTGVLFPFVLEQTWERRLPAFSDTVAHARRGLLFVLYPDFFEVGKELGDRTKATVAGKTPASPFTFTRAARLALNTRTAQHLGIPLGADVNGQATVLFPAQ